MSIKCLTSACANSSEGTCNTNKYANAAAEASSIKSALIYELDENGFGPTNLTRTTRTAWRNKSPSPSQEIPAIICRCLQAASHPRKVDELIATYATGLIVVNDAGSQVFPRSPVYCESSSHANDDCVLRLHSNFRALCSRRRHQVEQLY